MTNLLITVVLLSFIVSCTSVQYYPPSTLRQYENSVTINKPKTSVWKQFIAGLTKEFFVINNLDKETGLVNVSYSGDPADFIDCGQVYISTPQGDFRFAGAVSRTQYNTSRGLLNVVRVTRTIELEGRANLLVQDVDKNTTRVTANVRYLVTRTSRYRDMQGRSGSHSQRTNFNSGGSGSLISDSGSVLTCQPTGALEQRLLALAGTEMEQPAISGRPPLEPKIALPQVGMPQTRESAMERSIHTVEVGKRYLVMSKGVFFSPQPDLWKKIELPSNKSFRILWRVLVSTNTWAYQIELSAGERGYIREQDATGYLKNGLIIEDAKTVRP